MTQPQVKSGSVWDDLGFLVVMCPTLALLAGLYLAFGLIGLAAAGLIALTAFLGWAWLHEGGW